MAKKSKNASQRRAEEAAAARREARRRQQRNRSLAGIAAVIAVVAVISGLLLNRNDGPKAAKSSKGGPSTTQAPKTSCPPAGGEAQRTLTFEAAPPLCIDAAKTYTADFDTTEGHIVIALDTKKTPKTTNNFVVLSRYKYYNGTNIVRIAKSIDIIQGGAPHTQTNADPGPGYNIDDEGSGFTYKEGDLAMANTGSPNSGGAQFFLGTGPKISNLNESGSYTNFGHIIQGLDVAQKIAALSPPGDYDGAPTKTVTIKTVTITES